MSSDLFELRGKVAVVTGGSRGLGLDISEGFLAAGAKKVYISSRKAKACDEAVEYLNKFAKEHNLSGTAEAVPADLGNRAGAEHLFNEVSKKESKVDILIANAGATWGAPFEEHSDSAFQKVMDLNVKGVFACIQLFAPLLESAGTAEDPSRILITGSIAGLKNSLSGGTYGYLASKAAVHHLGRTLAIELGPRHITVNILAPGWFPTKMSNGLLEVLGDEAVNTNPLGRLGKPADIIGVSTFLCSPAASYVNGVTIPIDGGASKL